MVCHQEIEIFHTIYHNAIVIDQILAVEEIIGCQQEIPGQTTEPWQTMDAVHLISNRNDFLETFHLHQQSLQRYNSIRTPMPLNDNQLNYRYHQCQWSAINDETES